VARQVRALAYDKKPDRAAAIAMTRHLGRPRGKGDSLLCAGQGKTANPGEGGVFGNKVPECLGGRVANGITGPTREIIRRGRRSERSCIALDDPCRGFYAAALR